MDDGVERDHIQLLLQVARWYYQDDLSQSTIADRVGFSRSTVSRLLSESKRRGVVRVAIGHPLERQVALEKALRERFGLREVRVAQVDAGRPVLTSVAITGAEVLVEAVRKATVLATSAGTTIAALVDELPTLALRDLHVVQMIGALSRTNPLTDSPEITRRIAERLGGDYRQMPAPLIVRTTRLAAALRKEEAVANALALASHADVALVGIGATGDAVGPGRIFHGWLTPEEAERVRRMGAVGHISGLHFDAAGRQLEGDLRDRVMSVPLDRLSGIGTVIAVATGQEKVAAIRGAALGRFMNVLVTDAATALAILRVDRPRP